MAFFFHDTSGLVESSKFAAYTLEFLLLVIWHILLKMTLCREKMVKKGVRAKLEFQAVAFGACTLLDQVSQNLALIW